MFDIKIFWIRVWLILAAILIIAAYFHGFQLSRALFSSDCRTATLLILSSAFLLYRGIKENAKNHFDLSDRLWYASFSAFTFISFILFVFWSVFIMLIVICDARTRRQLFPEQMQFLLPAFTILILIALNRPKKYSSTPSRQYYPNRERFKKKRLSPRRQERYRRPRNPPKPSKRLRTESKSSLAKDAGFLKRKTSPNTERRN